MIIYPEIMAAVRSGFDAGWSPEKIAGRMRLERHSMRVSHETIYRYAFSKNGRAEKFYQHVPRQRRNRRPRGMRKHHGRQFLDELAVRHRPEAIGERREFGHWECDMVMFRKEFGKANVTSLVGRVTRFTVVLKNPDSLFDPCAAGSVPPHQALRIPLLLKPMPTRWVGFMRQQQHPIDQESDLLTEPKGSVQQRPQKPSFWSASKIAFNLS